MKNSIKKLFTILAIGMSFVAVQSVCAETVDGTIESISTRPNVVTIEVIENDGDGEFVDVYGVKFNYLCNQYNICLEAALEEGEDVYVSFEYYEYVCSDGTTKYKATSIKVDDVTVELR